MTRRRLLIRLDDHRLHNKVIFWKILCQAWIFQIIVNMFSIQIIAAADNPSNSGGGSGNLTWLFARDDFRENRFILHTINSFELLNGGEEDTQRERLHDFNKLVKWFGKSYILTTEPRISEDSVLAARACGFDPYLLPVEMPWNHVHGSTESYINYCLSTPTGSATHTQNIQFMKSTNMTLGEISQICSHRKALQKIVSDEFLSEEDWTLILEDGAKLHPAATNARELISEAIVTQRLNYAYGFIYLGTCHPSCLTIKEKYARDCYGNCTHAYAITKSRAQTLYEELYCRVNHHKAPCGLHKADNRIGISLAEHFAHPVRSAWDKKHQPRALLLGLHLKSPIQENSFGLIYQSQLPAAPAHIGLMKALGFDQLLTSPTHNCLNIKFDGRMGNLLFQYGSLIGICVKRGFDYKTCAGFPHTFLMGEKIELPVDEFGRVFNLPEILCVGNDSSVYQENNNKYAIKFDPYLFDIPFGTMIHGYLQSYKYFHPHAETQIRKAFDFPDYLKEQGEKFLDMIYERMNDPNRQSNLTCLHIRRGDKVRGWNKGPQSVYNPWALSIEFYMKALEYARTWHPNLNLVFFVGGGFLRKEYIEDRSWVRERLMTMALEGDNIFLAPEELSHMTVMYALTRCNHLVISSSSFSWWAGYLSRAASLIIAPKIVLAPSVIFAPEDHYPPGWILLDKDSPPPQYAYNETTRPHIKPWEY